MSTHEIAPDKEHLLPTLANILLIAWGYSLLWGGGLIFSGGAFYAAMWGGWWSSDGGPVWETLTVIALILGLTATFFSLILLGRMITRNWQRGIKAGLGSFLTGILTFLAVWIGDGVFYEWTSSWSVYLIYSLIISLAACSTIVTLIWLTKTLLYHYLELIAGVVIGIGLSVISGMILGASLLKGNNIFHFIWQIPPLVWISVIYFAELVAGRSKWIDFLVWVFLVLISFGLPFVLVPIFPSISN